jgi:hypothetical protein
LLLYASQTGRTLQLVDAVRASVALADDLQFNCLPAEQATLDDLLEPTASCWQRRKILAIWRAK